jgi:hypothetical protein
MFALVRVAVFVVARGLLERERGGRMEGTLSTYV